MLSSLRMSFTSFYYVLSSIKNIKCLLFYDYKVLTLNVVFLGRTPKISLLTAGSNIYWYQMEARSLPRASTSL